MKSLHKAYRTSAFLRFCTIFLVAGVLWGCPKKDQMQNVEGDHLAVFTKTSGMTTITANGSDGNSYQFIFKGRPGGGNFNLQLLPKAERGFATGMVEMNGSSHSFINGSLNLSKKGDMLQGSVNGEVVDAGRTDTVRVEGVNFDEIPIVSTAN